MLPGYPKCAGETEIENWIEHKIATFKVIDQKIDFIERLKRAVVNAESFLAQAPLRSGIYTDGGHRFRFNKFERIDKWYSP